MTAMVTANKELKWMMKTVRIEDIHGMQYKIMDLIDVSNEIQETIGRSYYVPDYIDEENKRFSSRIVQYKSWTACCAGSHVFDEKRGSRCSFFGIQSLYKPSSIFTIQAEAKNPSSGGCQLILQRNVDGT